MTASSPLDPRIVRQASQWWVDLQSDDAGASLHHACAAWRSAHPEHERAWARVQAVAGKLKDVPEPLVQATLLTNTRGGRRRQVIKTLALLAGAGGVGLLASRLSAVENWRADEATRVGEWRHVVLPDGSRVVLNTDTAIDVRFDASQRRLVLLRGEILITTARDTVPEARAFKVETRHGTLRALGTRFLVRQDQDDSELQVYEGAVEIGITPDRRTPIVVQKGERTRFSRLDVTRAGRALDTSMGWTRGMLVAHDMPLRAFLAELSRYRRGHLGCEDQIANLPVSGTFPLADTERVLQALQHELPVEIQRRTDYWVRLHARSS